MESKLVFVDLKRRIALVKSISYKESCKGLFSKSKTLKNNGFKLTLSNNICSFMIIFFDWIKDSVTWDQEEKKEMNKMKVFNKRIQCLNFNIF